MEPDFSQLSLEEIYQELAQLIVNGINEEWHVATMRAIVRSDDHVTFEGRYSTSAHEPTERSFRLHYTAFDLVLELRQRLHRPETQPFTEMNFTLHHTGKFDLDLTYPDEGAAS